VPSGRARKTRRLSPVDDIRDGAVQAVSAASPAPSSISSFSLCTARISVSPSGTALALRRMAGPAQRIEVDAADRQQAGLADETRHEESAG